MENNPPQTPADLLNFQPRDRPRLLQQLEEAIDRRIFEINEEIRGYSDEIEGFHKERQELQKAREDPGSSYNLNVSPSCKSEIDRVLAQFDDAYDSVSKKIEKIRSANEKRKDAAKKKALKPANSRR